ncbi:Polynucleotidyl transferase, ribonuclease H-like superfamily protein [Senna tora]|uniref:Polynucleotidyl transferase, ribonuclease H-like superfamily protein n=1 Tax=Senna tora TaxID=362788 RepID=A0A834T1W3_9FABA|nr:Polynucleotidyl transferase, ribonuclease H-like superfamily protein [Senna tora]
MVGSLILCPPPPLATSSLLAMEKLQENMLVKKLSSPRNTRVSLCLLPLQILFEDLEGTMSFGSNLSEWINDNLSVNRSGNRNTNWCSVFAIATWLVWKKRNNFIFHRITGEADKLLDTILMQVKLYEEANILNKLIIAKGDAQNNPTFGWKSPKEGWFKIIVDGSRFEESNIISCGGVIRNSEGSWVGGFSKNLGRDYFLS